MATDKQSDLITEFARRLVSRRPDAET